MKARKLAFERKQAKRYGGKNHKLGQDNFATILRNDDGFMWTGEIYMGKLSKMDVVYDTGSDWLVIEGQDCNNCEGNTYDITPSIETGDAVALSESSSTREYGSAQLVGKEYTDTVCILFSACVTNFEFFLIESQTGIREPIDGIMGLSRNKPFHISPEQGNTTGPLYIEKMTEAGLISENKFSFYFKEPGQLSWVDLGTPVESNIRGDAIPETI